MTTRYFKFTDGTRTVFRGTGKAQGFRFGWTTPRGWVGFSNSPVNSNAATYPTTEITKAEFNTLVALKAARVLAAGRSNQDASSPQDAWVDNYVLAPKADPCPASEYLTRYGNLVGFRP